MTIGYRFKRIIRSRNLNKLANSTILSNLSILLLSSVFLLISLTSIQGQESITINYSSENTKLTKIGNSLEEGREEMRENYKLYGNSALML